MAVYPISPDHPDRVDLLPYPDDVANLLGLSRLSVLGLSTIFRSVRSGALIAKQTSSDCKFYRPPAKPGVTICDTSGGHIFEWPTAYVRWRLRAYSVGWNP